MKRDTNKILQELRDLFNMKVPHQPMHRMRIAELFERLDTALSNGESLPDDWAQSNTETYVCAFCRHKFGSPQELQEHIERYTDPDAQTRHMRGEV